MPQRTFSIDSPLPLVEVVRKLRAVTAPPTSDRAQLSAITDGVAGWRLVGQVSNRELVVRSARDAGNGFAPVLRASMRDAGVGTVVTGRVTTSTGVSVFMVGWLVVVGLITIFGAIEVGIVPILFGLLMIGGALLVFRTQRNRAASPGTLVDDLLEILDGRGGLGQSQAPL
jgi:hypothetical protein